MATAHRPKKALATSHDDALSRLHVHVFTQTARKEGGGGAVKRKHDFGAQKETAIRTHEGPREAKQGQRDSWRHGLISRKDARPRGKIPKYEFCTVVYGQKTGSSRL